MTTAKDVIRQTLGSADMIVQSYVKDLSDDDLTAPPADGMNPIAWQLGHLIAVERSWVEQVKPGSSPPLPEGFEAAHGKETAAPNRFRRFCSKDDYLRAWSAQRAATLAALDALTDEQLDKESGVSFAPTTAALMNMIGVHGLMHCGQFVQVRRRAGMPVVI